MSTRPRMTTKQKLLAFGPALLVIGATALTASGLSMVGGATAATSVTVTGSVGSNLQTNPSASGTCTSGSVAFTNGWAGAARVVNGCTFTHGTNDEDGSRIEFANGSTDKTAVFCNDLGGGRDCADGQVDDVAGTGQQLTAGSFGLALEGVDGATNSAGAGVGSVDNGGTAVTATDAMWARIPAGTVGDPATTLCTTTEDYVSGPAPTCTVAFGVHGHGLAVQPAGDYDAVINFTAFNN